MYFVILQTVLLAILAAMFYWHVGPGPIELPVYVGFLGKALAVGGLLLVGGAAVSLGSATRVAPEPGAPTLIKRGVYRYLRHPMYTSVIAATIGLILMQPRLSVAIAGMAVIVFYLFKTRYEERLLLNRYPDYAAYRAKTFGVVLTKPRKDRN